MTTLTDFLLARITEDEGAVTALDSRDPAEWLTRMDRLEFDNEYGLARSGIGRVLAECEAKRRIVELYNEAYDNLENNWDEIYEGSTGALSDVVFTLAQVYVDHPDFNPSWNA